MLLFPLCPHGGAAGSGWASVWHSRPARPGGGVRVPAAAAGEPAGRHQHPGAGERVPEGREHHPSVLLPDTSTHTHLLSSGDHTEPQKYSIQLLIKIQTETAAN